MRLLLGLWLLLFLLPRTIFATPAVKTPGACFPDTPFDPYDALYGSVCAAPPSFAAGVPDGPTDLTLNEVAGFDLGITYGVSAGDYDQDGLVDVYVNTTGSLFKNMGGGVFAHAATLSTNTLFSYGASFADYDGDGDPDLITEPRVAIGTGSVQLFENMGGGNFVDVTLRDLGAAPGGSAETAVWADVNADGWLDAFLPIYWDNKLWQQSWTGSGSPRFSEQAATAGLLTPAHHYRPEGAFAADLDHDGDLDIVVNGGVYSNQTPSRSAQAQFQLLSNQAIGVPLNLYFDEGVVVFDYDMDGDFDIVIQDPSGNISGSYARLYENRGDATFSDETGLISDPLLGTVFGASAVDWDLDGDLDFTHGDQFRRNMLVEGQRQFVVANVTVPQAERYAMTPAWADFDNDGDLDVALGNWSAPGKIYLNALHQPGQPLGERSYVRVRPVARRNGITGQLGQQPITVPTGLETQYGARVEVMVHGDPSRRMNVVSSAGGYLNQNEYALTFGLSQIDHNHPFDLRVTFPSVTYGGIDRVDGSMNPILRNLTLAELTDREVTIFDEGGAIVNGCQVHPDPPTTTRWRLAGREKLDIISDPVVQDPGSVVGLEFHTWDAATRVGEIMLDGVLSPGYNVAIYDVTDPQPVAVYVDSLRPEPRNIRSVYPVSILLQPQRTYWLLAAVESYRPRFMVTGGYPNIRVHTNHSFTLTSAGAFTTSTQRLSVSLSTREEPRPFMRSMGDGFATGGNSPGQMVVFGSLAAGTAVQVGVQQGLPSASNKLHLGFGVTCAIIGTTPVLTIEDPISMDLPPSDSQGALSVSLPMPYFEPGTDVFVQVWQQGASGQVAATDVVWLGL